MLEDTDETRIYLYFTNLYIRKTFFKRTIPMELLKEINEEDIEVNFIKFKDLVLRLRKLEQEFKQLPGIRNFKNIKWMNTVKLYRMDLLDDKCLMKAMQCHPLDTLFKNNIDIMDSFDFLEKVLKEVNEHYFFEKICMWHNDVEKYRYDPETQSFVIHICDYMLEELTHIIKYELFVDCNVEKCISSMRHYKNASYEDRKKLLKIRKEVFNEERCREQCGILLLEIIERKLSFLTMLPLSSHLNIKKEKDISLKYFEWDMHRLHEDFKSCFLKVCEKGTRCSLVLNFMNNFSSVCKEIEDYFMDLSNSEQDRHLLMDQFQKCLTGMKNRLIVTCHFHNVTRLGDQIFNPRTLPEKLSYIPLLRRIGDSAPIPRSHVVMDYEEERIFGTERINYFRLSSKASWR
ncbi:hypothetical protein CDAR_292831 [Caerostris darwini]|uniref:Uncharacterized protein n=1 Tax=Caerostris darwini TaxID=1538125 RepID=A0AAV4MAZ0_9ARAC|nr:hypothetical protein CDAR_292831 [Caerostris darwini]